MAASILYLVMIFGAVSVVALLLVAIHDAIAAYFNRRVGRSSRVVGEGRPPLLPPRTRIVASRARRAPQPLVLREAAEARTDRHSERADERPAWLDAAQRDVAHR